MPDYPVRLATLDDVDALVHHRLSMFSEMGTPFDAPIIREMFRDWLLQKMPSGKCQIENSCCYVQLLRTQYKARVRPIMLLFPHDSTPTGRLCGETSR